MEDPPFNGFINFAKGRGEPLLDLLELIGRGASGIGV
jgi:hypothetical protein